MIFGKNLKVKIDSLSLEEAKVFITFLETEIERHKWDIEEAEKLIIRVRGLNEERLAARAIKDNQKSL